MFIHSSELPSACTLKQAALQFIQFVHFELVSLSTFATSDIYLVLTPKLKLELLSALLFYCIFQLCSVLIFCMPVSQPETNVSGVKHLTMAVTNEAS